MRLSALTALLALPLLPLAMAADCGGGPPPDDDDDGCFCIEVYDPVCGVDGETYSNECYAECAGVAVAYPGECQEPPTCDDVDCPVGHCELIEVQCFTQPCFPQPTCVDEDGNPVDQPPEGEGPEADEAP